MPFDYEEYEQKCATMGPEALQKEWENYTRQISGGATSTAGSVLFAPITGGASLVGLGLSTPRIHNARKKREIIEAALQKRGLTHNTRKRDVFVPMTVAGALGGLSLGLAGAGAQMIAGGAVGHGVEYAVSHAALEIAGASLEHAHDDHKKTKEQLKLVQAGHSIGEVPKNKNKDDGLAYGYAYGLDKPQKVSQGPEQPVPVPHPYSASNFTKQSQETIPSQTAPPPYQPSNVPQGYLIQIQQQESKVEITSSSQTEYVAGVDSSAMEKNSYQSQSVEIMDPSAQQLVLQWDASRGVYILAPNFNSAVGGIQPIIDSASQTDSKAATSMDSCPNTQPGNATETPFQQSGDEQVGEMTHMIAELMGDNPTFPHEEADLYGIDNRTDQNSSQGVANSMHDKESATQKLQYYPPPPASPLSAPVANAPSLPPRPVSTQGYLQDSSFLTSETYNYPPPPPRPHSSNQNLSPTNVRPTSQVYHIPQYSPAMQQQYRQGQQSLPQPPPQPLSWNAYHQNLKQEQPQVQIQPTLPSYQPASHHQQCEPQQYRSQPGLHPSESYRPKLPQRPNPQPIQHQFEQRQQTMSSISSTSSLSPTLSIASTVSPLSTPLTTYATPYDISCGQNGNVNGNLSQQPMYFPPPPSTAARRNENDYFGLGKLESKRLSWNGSAGAPMGGFMDGPNYGPSPPVPQAYK